MTAANERRSCAVAFSPNNDRAPDLVHGFAGIRSQSLPSPAPTHDTTRMLTSFPDAPPAFDPNPAYASFLRRVAATLLDWLLIYGLFFCVAGSVRDGQYRWLV